MAVRRRATTTALAVLAAALAPALSACGSASEPSPPTGVDGLVIPTPSVDPHDFVTGVDNPWLPLRQGARWTYDVRGENGQSGVATMTVTVRSGTTRVDGVATTAVETVGGGPGEGADTVDYYAQDQDGNVWWLGRAGVWQAGDDGAEAGLAMPAHPRRGDGWREGYRPGVVEDRAEVESLDGDLSVPRGHFDDVLGLQVTSDLSPGIVLAQSYARGVGLVQQYAADGPSALLQLVSGP